MSGSAGSAHELIVLDVACAVESFVLRTNKEQCGGVSTCADRSPADDLLLLGEAGGNAVAEGIVRLYPQNVILLLRTAVTVVDKTGSALGRKCGADGVAVSIVGNAHVLGVGRNVEFAGICEDFAVNESVGVLRFDRVGDRRPIIGSLWDRRESRCASPRRNGNRQRRCRTAG